MDFEKITDEQDLAFTFAVRRALQRNSDLLVRSMKVAISELEYESQIITEKEAIEKFRISASTFYRLRKNGKIKPISLRPIRYQMKHLLSNLGSLHHIEIEKRRLERAKKVLNDLNESKR